MKIYTKFGDQGATMLGNGRKVAKTSLRIEGYGTADELNAVVGLFRDSALPYASTHPHIVLLLELSLKIQDELFQLGSELACPDDGQSRAMQRLEDKCIKRLEEEIDQMWEPLPALRSFVIPGGHSTNSQLHLCRCICRRLERSLNRLHAEEALRPTLLVYVNRLSDWFFAAARFASFGFAAPEVLWNSK